MNLTVRAPVALVSAADHLRGHVAEDLAAFDDLRIAEPVRRESIRVELRGASRRYRYADGYPAVMLNGPRLMGVYAALLAAFAVFCIRNWEVQPVSFALHLLVAAGVPVVSLVVTYAQWIPYGRRPVRLVASLGLGRWLHGLAGSPGRGDG